MNYIEPGKILQQAKTSAGLTQKEVADRLNITYQNVSNWERGKSKLDIDSLFYLRKSMDWI